MIPLFRRISFPVRLIILFSVFSFNQVIFLFGGLACLMPLGFTLQSFVNHIPETNIEVNAYLFLEGISEIGTFLFTAFLFAQLESPNANRHLRAVFTPSLRMVILAIISIFVAQFFIDFLITLNGKIPLPDWLGDLKKSEKQAEDVTNALLNFKGFGQFIIVSIVLAVIPAVCEEFFFRGLLLGDMLKEKINPAVAIVVSGLVFAIGHWEFQNTLGIWVLGIFLGYLYYVSGSIWLSVAAHFTNNMLDILLNYFYNIGVISKDLANVSAPPYLVAGSVVVFAICIFIFNRWKEPVEFAYEEIAQEEEHTDY